MLKMTNQNINSKFNVNYSPSLFSNNLHNDLKNPNSNIQKFLKLKDNYTIEKFRKASYWYIKGEESIIYHEKFLNYWISLEFMSNLNNDSTIKKNIINVGSSILLLTSFDKELENIYIYVLNQICEPNPNKILESKLNQINGIDNIYSKVNSKVFANTLDIVYEYINDEYVKYKITEFIKVYQNTTYQKQCITRLNYNYKNILRRLYKMRNLIVHNAVLDNDRLQLYTNYLEIICKRLLHNIMLQNDEITIEWNYEYIDHLYKEWFKSIDEGKLVSII